jgi:hypothetical protein
MRVVELVVPFLKEEDVTVSDGKIEGVVQRVDEQFTAEALAAQDGKTVPFRKEPGGEIIGEATLHYDPTDQALKASLETDDPKVAEYLHGTLPNIFG